MVSLAVLRQGSSTITCVKKKKKKHIQIDQRLLIRVSQIRSPGVKETSHGISDSTDDFVFHIDINSSLIFNFKNHTLSVFSQTRVFFLSNISPSLILRGHQAKVYDIINGLSVDKCEHCLW